MSKFRKKPVVIEARQVTPRHVDDIAKWCGSVDDPRLSPWPITIRTLEGDMYADFGDWIIRGVNNEFYPCKPDIFEKTYEPVEDQQ